MHHEHRRDLFKTAGALLAAGVLSRLGWHARAAAPEGRPTGAQVPSAPSQPTGKTPIVAVGPAEGVVRWLQPDSAQHLGSGALLNVKIDRLSVPHTTMMVATQKLAASGIPVHSHTWEDEIIYVINGRGFAVINEEQTSVPIETGSVLYIPIGEWHGLKNADPKAPMDILLVTTPVKPNGLGDFFRFATVEPAHMAKASFTRVGNSAGSPKPSLRPLPAAGHDADILAPSLPVFAYDPATELRQSSRGEVRRRCAVWSSRP